MELFIDNGRYAAVSGGLKTVSGADELVQRVGMRLGTRRGSYALMPEYGSLLHLLAQTKPSERLSAARRYVAEALEGESGAELLDVELTQTETGAAKLYVSLKYNGESITLLASAV